MNEPQALPLDADGIASDIALIAWLARYHALPFSSSALRATLPAGIDLASPVGIARALNQVGLKSRQVTLSPTRVDPAALPSVLFRTDGTSAILLRKTDNRKRYIVVDPGADTLEVEMSPRALRCAFTTTVMLVSPNTASARRSAARPATETSQRAWFWRPVRENWPLWGQIMIAAFCLNMLNLALPIFVMNVYDRVIPNTAFVTLWTLAIGVTIALLLDVTLRTLRSNILETISRRVDLRVASSLFDQTMNVRLMARTGGAAGMANTIRDFESVRDFFGSASFVALIDLLFIGLFVAALFIFVGPLAYIPLIAIPFVVTLAIVAQVPLRKSAAQAQQIASRRHMVLIESLLGIEAIKSLNGEQVMQREWEAAIAASSRITGQTRFWSSLATNGTLLAQQAVSVAIIVWGVFLVSESQITVGALIAANILAGRVLAPLAAISQTIFRAHYARVAMRALNELMSLPRERSPGVLADLRVTRGEIGFRDVSFRYPSAQLPALDGVSFDIQPGEVVALLGRVGSGKTTTGKLMNGLLIADTGTILIDHHAAAQYDPAELRDGVGYLTQESELFTGSLRENMVIGKPDASDEEIREALYLAGMDEIVATNPAGLDMDIGEKGSRLSGGQKQGMALARLLLRKPRVLFLDEPTNSMDQQMESAVIERLQTLDNGETTLIFCTHRMSLANMAARFIVLDRGRKMLDGPKQEVLDQLRAGQSQRLGG